MTFEDKLVAEYPRVYRFACKRTQNVTMAEDVVQTSMLKALEYRDTFVEGTNMFAWLCTIAHNTMKDMWRRNRIDADGGEAASMLAVPASQYAHCELIDTLRNFAKLSTDQQIALSLVIAGEEYDDVAKILHEPMGTIKSRVCRSRQKLEMMR